MDGAEAGGEADRELCWVCCLGGWAEGEDRGAGRKGSPGVQALPLLF